MTYTVIWSPAAEFRLTEIWLTARDRESISDAIARLDQQLQRTPLTTGESREGNARLVFTTPLEVLFEVNQQRNEVYVRNLRYRA